MSWGFVLYEDGYEFHNWFIKIHEDAIIEVCWFEGWHPVATNPLLYEDMKGFHNWFIKIKLDIVRGG